MKNQCLYFQIVKELYFLAERVYGVFFKETLSDPLARITSPVGRGKEGWKPIIPRKNLRRK